MKVVLAIVAGLVVVAVMAGVAVVVVLRASTGDQASLTREVPVEIVSQRTVESGSTREFVDVELQVRYDVDGTTFEGSTRIPANQGIPDPLRACVDPRTRPASRSSSSTRPAARPWPRPSTGPPRPDHRSCVDVLVVGRHARRQAVTPGETNHSRASGVGRLRSPSGSPPVDHPSPTPGCTR